MARIYLSSTYEDLSSAREAIYRGLRKLGHDVMAMEDYSASDKPTLQKTLEDVAHADIYIGIVAWRYGFIPSEDNPKRLSITELEYCRAKEAGIPMLLFLLNPETPWSPKYIDNGLDLERLMAFRRHVENERIVAFFSNNEELVTLVSVSVTNLTVNSGWQQKSGKVLIEYERKKTKKQADSEPLPCVFISYSHADARWLSRLHIHLSVIARLGIIDLWSDSRIKGGANWRTEIRDALRGAKAAVLLLSADFLASEFVMTNELPPLLAAAEQKGVLVLPVVVSACRFQAIEELSQLQSVNDPNKPLNLMNKGRQEQVFDQVSALILDRFGYQCSK